jgi:ATP-binding cassette subfamily B protein/subfamily B ATP-binding cassette protein MsbA
MLKQKTRSQRAAIFIKLYPFLKEGQKQYILLSMQKVWALLLSLVTPVFYLLLINNVMIGGNITLLPWVIAGYIAVYLMQTFGVVLGKMSYNKLFIKFKLKLKTQILRIYTKMDVKTYESYGIGDLKTRIEDDVAAAENFFNTHILDWLYSIISAVVISVILLFMSPVLALTSFIMVPVSFWFTKFMGKKVYILNEERRVIRGKCESFMFLCFTNWKEIKANNLEKKHSEIFRYYRYKLNPLFVKNQVYWYINRTFIAFKDFFITRMNLYFLGGLLIIAGQMNVGVLLVFMNYYAQFFDNITKITDSVLGLKNDTPSIDRITEILGKEIPGKPEVKIISDDIAIEDVSFRYSDEQPLVLSGINLSVKSGEHIALAGRSGCGKTTLAMLLMGLYEPLSGEVRIGGVNINETAFESIGKKAGIVLQDPPLFNLTIRENLEFAKRGASEDEYISACKKANIYDFIDGLPDRFDTIIGERGIKLSGGQKQRLSIARVILQNPDIIIFDEATSSLDSENEKAIVSAINDLSCNKTVITIAHRLSTVLACDRVVVIDNGKITAIGTHRELRGNNKVYDLLFEKQYRAEAD